MVPRSASAPCRLSPKLPLSRRCLNRLPRDLKLRRISAFWPGGNRRKQPQESAELVPVQNRALSQRGTVSAEPFHTAPSVGTGTIQDSAKPVSSEKDPGRGRRFLPAVPAPSKRESAPGAMRVFLISDIHTDYEENLDWIRDLSTTSFLNDALIVAGDVSDSIPIFEETFRILRPKFAHVFFTPGNHDLWLRSNTAPVPQTASEPLAKPDSKPASEPTSEPGPGADINPRTDDETNPETEGNPATVPVSTPEPGRSDASRAGSNFTQVTKGVSENHRAPASSTLLGVDISDPPENSLSKLAELFKICEDLGVDTRPKFLKPVGESGRTREAGSASEHGGELSEGRGLGESSLVGDRADDGKNGLQAVPDSQRRETNGRGSIGECSCIADISASVDKTDCVARTLSHIGEGERKKEAGTSERVASDSVQPVDGSARSSLTGKKEAQRTSGSEAGLNGENEGRTAEARVVDTSSSLDGRLRGPEEWLKSQTGENGGGGNPVREPENRTRGSEDGVRTEENGSRAHESGTKGGETGTSGAETGTRGGETGTSGGEIGTRGGETGTNGVESERRGGGSESKGCGDGPGGSVSEAESGRGSGVAEEAHSLAGVWVVPILSWHHISFDTEPDIPGYKIPPIEKVAKDHKVCKWPPGLDPRTESVARAFDQMNHELHRGFDQASNPGSHVITFSHFLPRLELIPEKRFLFYPNLAKAVGSHALEARVRAIHAAAGGAPGCHLFGHTHFSWDTTLDGVRYIQAPLAYPRERKRRMNGGDDWLPLCVYDSSRGGVLTSENRCYWSDYYKTHAREPENFEFAPWVANLWKPIRKAPEPAGKV